MNENDFFILIDNFKIVKGYNRFLILDPFNNDYYTISNEYLDIIRHSGKKRIYSILKEFDDNSRKNILDFLLWAKNKNFLYFTEHKDEIKLFAKYNNVYEMPYEITNIIVDVGEESKKYLNKITEEVLKLKIPHIQFRFFYNFDNIDFLNKFLYDFYESTVKSIDLLIPYESIESSLDKLSQLATNHLRLTNVIIYNSKLRRIDDLIDGNTRIVHTSENICSSIFCGEINEANFSINKFTFFESLKHNTCLNKKVSIDILGNIKNCPNMPDTFGNIKHTTLEEAINIIGFKKYWDLKKDEIAICKDCEYRHICTDCRAYIEVPEDMYSKPLKCGYNPYTNEWSNWIDSPLKQEAIAYYGLNEIIKS